MVLPGSRRFRRAQEWAAGREVDRAGALKDTYAWTRSAVARWVVLDAVGSGARDTGEDTPEPGGEGRPVGTVDEDANPPMSDPTKSETSWGTGELPPQDTGSAVPPYEGHQEGGA